MTRRRKGAPLFEKGDMLATSARLVAAFESVSEDLAALDFKPRPRERATLAIVGKGSADEGLPGLAKIARAWLVRNPKSFFVWVQRRVRQRAEAPRDLLSRLTPALILRVMLRDWLAADLRTEIEAAMSSPWRLYSAVPRPPRRRRAPSVRGSRTKAG